MRKLLCISMAVLICVTTFSSRNTVHAAQLNVDSSNLLINGGFEEGDFSPSGFPDSWIPDIGDSETTNLVWDDSQAYEGLRSFKITAGSPSDVYLFQKISVQPHTNYRISGWIKTENVGHRAVAGDTGVTLSLLGVRAEHTNSLYGTNDWTYVSFAFNSADRTEVRVAARLEYWSGTTTATAWFDDLEMAPIQASDPHPGWKILTLIYDTVDFTSMDSSGISHHYSSVLTQEEKEKTVQEITNFVEEDIPALTTGNMIPTVTFRHPERALTKLTPVGEGLSPSPDDIAEDLDPAFDSVIVIWDPMVLDQTTGETTFIGAAAGLAYRRGTGQTYAAIIVDAVTTYGHRNVLRHEWGHSILFFYEAYGTAPVPAVDNHAFGTPETQYVHCPTGQPYILQDETLDNPIPNSIYNNDSGFTHDYYSGTTATQDQPTRCLGITPEAWASGGPVSKPLRPLTPEQRLQLIRNNVDQLVHQGDLAKNQAKLLHNKLDTVDTGIQQERYKSAVKNLQLFIQKVEGLIKTERLPQNEGLILIDQATDLINQLKG